MKPKRQQRLCNAYRDCPRRVPKRRPAKPWSVQLHSQTQWCLTLSLSLSLSLSLTLVTPSMTCLQWFPTGLQMAFSPHSINHTFCIRDARPSSRSTCYHHCFHHPILFYPHTQPQIQERPTHQSTKLTSLLCTLHGTSKYQSDYRHSMSDELRNFCFMSVCHVSIHHSMALLWFLQCLTTAYGRWGSLSWIPVWIKLKEKKSAPLISL